MEQHPFLNVSHSVAAARTLLGRAQEQRSWIEGIVLYASVIDALLRILLAHATAERDDDPSRLGGFFHDDRRLDSSWFFHDDRVWRNERKVYRAARDVGVLTEPQFEALEALWKFRNVVVHRFVISGVTYDEIPSKLDEYEVIYRRLYADLEAIEQPEADATDDEIAKMRERIARKLGESE